MILSNLPKKLSVFIGSSIIVYNMIKVVYFNEFLFSLIWNSNILGTVLIFLECLSALMLIFKRKIYIFAIILLLLFSFQIFNYSSKTIQVGFFSGCLFLSIENIIVLLILFNLSALIAYLFSQNERKFHYKLINLLLLIVITGTVLYYEYELISSSIKLKAEQENELRLFSKISDSFNDLGSEKAGKLRVYFNDADINCGLCFERIPEFLKFLSSDEHIFNKVTINVTFLTNSDGDSIDFLQKINRWMEINQIKFPVYFHRLECKVEEIKNYIVLLNKSGNVLFASRLPLRNQDYNRIINILKKLQV